MNRYVWNPWVCVDITAGPIWHGSVSCRHSSRRTHFRALATIGSRQHRHGGRREKASGPRCEEDKAPTSFGMRSHPEGKKALPVLRGPKRITVWSGSQDLENIERGREASVRGRVQGQFFQTTRESTSCRCTRSGWSPTVSPDSTRACRSNMPGNSDWAGPAVLGCESVRLRNLWYGLQCDQLQNWCHGGSQGWDSLWNNRYWGGLFRDSQGPSKLPAGRGQPRGFARSELDGHADAEE